MWFYMVLYLQMYQYILIGSYLRSFRGETHSYVDDIINIQFWFVIIENK